MSATELRSLLSFFNCLLLAKVVKVENPANVSPLILPIEVSFWFIKRGLKLIAVLIWGIEVGETSLSPIVVSAMVVLCWDGMEIWGGGYAWNEDIIINFI